jgi:hypothetical protein
VLRTFAITTALFVSLAASPVLAQSSSACADGAWHRLEDADVLNMGVMERAEVFDDALKMATDRAHRIYEFVIDCPMSGYDIRAIRLPAMPGTAANYGLYVTVAYLHKGEMTDLIHRAWQQACMIRNGAADMTQRPAEDPDTPDIRRCTLDAAVAANDTEYARWLAREIGTDVPPKKDALNDPQKMIQDRINQMKRVPNAPSGALKYLEDLKRSFEAFPPMQ